MIAAIYARVSTDDQHCELQMSELGGLAQLMKWDQLLYTEKESTRRHRPVLEQLLADGRQAQI